MSDSSAKFSQALATLRTFSDTGTPRTYEYRIEALTKLDKLISENVDRICDALAADLSKPLQESLLAEVAVVLDEVRLTKKNLRKWIKPDSVSTPLSLWPSKSRIYQDPLGVVLIIGPWNYPFHLLMLPLVGAIAAGNCAMLKPSELTVHTSKLVTELISKYFPPEYVFVAEGGIPETTDLLNLKFDHIFFTGSTAVGKVVMAAAAKNLTPVTLELGGKSPVIVNDDADLDLAARRIVWGKFYNAGQTCVAPDYLYVHKNIAAQLQTKIKQTIEDQFGVNTKDSKSFARIVNSRNFQRLTKLVDKNKVVHGGQSDERSLFIEPTLIGNAQWNDEVMRDEIFGPILPILTFESLQEIYKTINSKPKPLAAYFFSRSKARQEEFLQTLHFGGGCINDLVVHLGNPHLPFGGVGESGTGSYHGKSSFLIFSHAKSVMIRSGWFDFSLRYAPYKEKNIKLLRKYLRI
ncbi:MAG: aldehyde dehydrogenase [Bdellovibrionota bacterium]